MLRIILFLLFYFFQFTVSAQSLNRQILSEPMHAKATVFAAYNNPSTLPKLQGIVVTAGSVRTFLLPELDQNFITGSFSQDSLGAFAINYLQAGNDDFKQINLSFGYARTFDPALSIYAGAIYYSVKEGENYGKKNVPGCALSIQGKLSKVVYLNSLFELPLKEDEWLFPSAVFHSGISIRCSETCLMEASGTIQGNENFRFKSGVHYFPSDRFNLRSGIQTKPFSVYMGCGVKWNSFTLDVSASHHPVAGFSPALMISWCGK